MVPVRNGKSDEVFFKTRKDDFMRLAHRRMYNTAVGTLLKMVKVCAVTALDMANL